MIELSPIIILFSFLAGAVLGGAFFGGLWFTSQHLASHEHPVLIFASSLALRFGLVLSGFYWLTISLHWQAMLLALIGFACARVFIFYLVSKPRESKP